MADQVKVININRHTYDDQVVSHSNIWWEYAVGWQLSLQFQFNTSNETSIVDAGNGDACRTDGAIQTDGDLVISVGFSDGFGVRRIMDDGTMTLLYGITKPDGAYTGYDSLALDKTRHIAYIGNYVYDRIVKIDYSDCVGGSDTVTIIGNLTESANDLPSDEVGGTMMGGLAMAGDYLYIMPDDKSSNKAMRWHSVTETDESLPMVNNTASGRYGRVFYDEPNDRIYGLYRDTISMFCVVNASNASDHATAPAVAYYISLLTAYGSNASQSSGVYVNPAIPNEIVVASYYGSVVKMDITPCVTGVSKDPTIIYRNPIFYLTWTSSAPKLGAYNSVVTHPERPMFISSAGADTNPQYGWMDMENCIAVGLTKLSGSHWDGAQLSRQPIANSLAYTSAPSPIYCTSAGGNTYMAVAGYGGDGYRFRTWETDLYQLHHTGNIVFGTFSLDDGANVKAFQLLNMAARTYVPSGCTFVVEVSNDDGVTWELYDYAAEAFHTFLSTGTEVKMKITMTGDGNKASYVIGTSVPTITLFSEASGEGSSGATEKISYKIQAI